MPKPILFFKACLLPPIIFFHSTTLSAISSSGHLAEHSFTTCTLVRTRLEQYFHRHIVSINKIKPNKKSDIEILFIDGTRVLVQNKNGTNNRGHSIDRRELEKYSSSPDLMELFRRTCLVRDLPNHVADFSLSPEIVRHLVLGTEPAYQPDFITHTLTSKNGTITDLLIAPMGRFVEFLGEGCYKNVLTKRTCVHASDVIYFQRKGGGRKDNRADDIQVKLKMGKEGVHDLFTSLICSRSS